TVNGGAATTSVIVSQAPVAFGTLAKDAVTGVAAVAAVSAAVGYQAVTKVTAVNQVNAVAAVSGVTANGVVTISEGALYGSKGLTGFATLGAAATLTTTSTGRVSVSIDGTTQSFDGSSGASTVTIRPVGEYNLTTHTIKAGSGTTNELILAGGNFQLNKSTG